MPTGRRRTSWLFTIAAKDLNSGLPRTNPASGQGGTLDSGPPDYKSSALTAHPHCSKNKQIDKQNTRTQTMAFTAN